MESIEYQKKRMPMWRRIAGVSEDATLRQIVDALVAKEEYAAATELVFASERTPELAKDQFGFALYMQLWTGILGQFLPQIAIHHHWGSGAGEGLAIRVRPGEVLTIEEPVATDLLKSWRGKN